MLSRFEADVRGGGPVSRAFWMTSGMREPGASARPRPSEHKIERVARQPKSGI
jgi:hypothetical protein